MKTIIRTDNQNMLQIKAFPKESPNRGDLWGNALYLDFILRFRLLMPVRQQLEG